MHWNEKSRVEHCGGGGIGIIPIWYILGAFSVSTHVGLGVIKTTTELHSYTRHDCFNLFVNSIVLGKTPETKKLHLNSKSIFFWPSSLIQDV